MKYLLALFLALPCYGVTANKIWRVPNGGTLPAWGPLNLAGGTAAVTGLLPVTSVAAPNYAVSGSSGSFGCRVSGGATNCTTNLDITNQSVTLTTNGRPVIIVATDDGSGGNEFQATVQNGGSPAACLALVTLLRGATLLAEFPVFINAGNGVTNTIANTIPVSAVSYFDVPAAGTYTYKLQAAASSATASCTINYANAKLVAYELF